MKLELECESCMGIETAVRSILSGKEPLRGTGSDEGDEVLFTPSRRLRAHSLCSPHLPVIPEIFLGRLFFHFNISIKSPVET